MNKTAQLKDTSNFNHQFAKMPTCLVSGAGSFLGAAICDNLIAQNCRVIAIDDQQNYQLGRLDKFEKYANFKLFIHDLTKGLPQDIGKIDYVFHLAGVEQYSENNQLTLSTLLVNSIGTEFLAKYATSYQAKFILASTIDVYHGALSGVSLDYYFGASQNDFAHYSHHEAKRYAEALLAEYHRTKHLDVRICRISEPYGPKMNLETVSEIAKLIKQALENKVLKVTGDGLEVVYPTYITDVAYGFIKVAFSKDAQGKIFSLVSPNGVTTRKLAETIEDIAGSIFNKNYEITYETNSSRLIFPIRQPDLSNIEKYLGWEPKTSLNDGLVETFASFVEKKEGELVPKKAEIFIQPVEKKKSNLFLGLFNLFKKTQTNKNDTPTTHQKTKKKTENQFTYKSTIFQLVLILAVTLTISLIGKLSVDLFLSLKLLKSSYHSLLEHDFQNSALKSQDSLIALKKLSKDIGFLNKYTLYKLESVDSAQKLVNSAINTAYSIDALSSSAIHISKFSSEVLKIDGKKENVTKSLNQSENFYNVAFGKLSFTVAELNSLPENPFPFGFGQEKITNLKNQLATTRESLIQLKQFYQLTPELVGFEKDINYLIIFQNNLEIRPTGGFIGSYAHISFSQGHLKKLLVDDIYNIDGQLKEKITPPQPLKKHLNIDRLYLRDSNWDPDLTVSAPAILDLYQKESGQLADALIAIDVNFIKALLVLTGPIELTDYNEKITSENLFDKAEYYAEIGFVPGSQNKKNFLASLSNQLIKKLLDPNFQKDLPKISKTTVTSASEKHFQLYFKNSLIQNLVIERNWAGKLANLINSADNKITNDYLLLVDSNVGANKANNFVTKTIQYHPTIKRDGDITSELTLTYKNSSPANTWPGGNYKNYLRVYTPAGSVIEKIDNNQNTDPKQIDVSFTTDKVVYGLLVEVPVQKEVKIVLVYKQALNINNIQTEEPSYNLTVQKQSGINSDPFELQIDFPSYLVPIKYPENSSVNPQTVSVDSNSQFDRNFQVVFNRK